MLGYDYDGQDQSPDMKPLPIQWSELAEEETRRIQECFASLSMFLDMIRYNNEQQSCHAPAVCWPTREALQHFIIWNNLK